jgi:hypothetical protein
MTHSKCHSVLAASFLLVAPAMFACGGGGSDPPADTPDAGGGGDDDDGPLEPPDGDFDYVYPDISHTGFDGEHTFKVPLATNLTDVTWSVEDPSIADVAPAATPEQFADFGETWALVTTKKAGTTKIIATSGGKTVSSELIVEAYTAADVSAGEQRYNNPADSGAPQRNACVSCHGLANGVDHSPLALAYFADDEIYSAVTTGAYPDGYELQGVNHAWNVTEAEGKGIVPYLRTLPLKGF